MLRRGYIAQADTEIELAAVDADEQHRKQEVPNAQCVEANPDAVLAAFIS